MNKAFWPIILTAVLGCQQSTTVPVVTCDPIASENGNLREVFKDCRTWIYQARYWDDEYNPLAEERVFVSATGRPWDQQPELQDEIIIQYEKGPVLRDELRPVVPNPTFENWTKREVTGVIEDGSRVWMHPFRSNHYAFTEVAGFPEVQLPLQQGVKWSRNLSIYDGWGDWSNTTISSFYGVVGEELIELPIGELSAWHIRATTRADFGTTRHDFWYHEEYGFVKMVIKNYLNQLLVIELVEVIDERG